MLIDDVGDVLGFLFAVTSLFPLFFLVAAASVVLARRELHTVGEMLYFDSSCC
jgi:hypothetical protein